MSKDTKQMINKNTATSNNLQEIPYRPNSIEWDGTPERFREIVNDKQLEDQYNAINIILTGERGLVENTTIENSSQLQILSTKNVVSVIDFKNVTIRNTVVLCVKNFIVSDNLKLISSRFLVKQGVVRINGDTELNDSQLFIELSEVSFASIRTLTLDDTSSIDIINSNMFIDYDRDVIEQDYIFYYKGGGSTRRSREPLLNIVGTTIYGHTDNDPRNKKVKFTNIPSKYYTQSYKNGLAKEETNYTFHIIIIVILIIIFLLVGYVNK